jgi:signal transduction histidine kinase
MATELSAYGMAYLAVGAVFLLYLLVLIAKMIVSAARERRQRQDERCVVFLELMTSFTNISVLTPKRYTEAIINALSSYLELENTSIGPLSTLPLGYQALLSNKSLVVEKMSLAVKIEGDEAPLYLLGEITSEKFRDYSDETLEAALQNVWKVVQAYRSEVVRHQTTSQVALSLQNQSAMMWRAIAGYQHDMAGLAQPFFFQLHNLFSVKVEAASEVRAAIDKLEKLTPSLQEFVRDMDDVITDLIKDEELYTQPLDMGRMFKYMFQYWIEEQEEARKNIVFDIQIPEGLTIWAADTAFFQAVWNPLKNAVKYTPDGQITITAKDEGGDFVSLTIQDTGQGIAPADLNSIGEFGFRSLAAQNTAEGKGIGLWITKRMMHKMGGTFVIGSRLGEGTTVTLEFRKAFSS